MYFFPSSLSVSFYFSQSHSLDIWRLVIGLGLHLRLIFAVSLALPIIIGTLLDLCYYFIPYDKVDSERSSSPWYEECELSFGKLKECLTSALVLALLVRGEGFIMFCDA